MPNRGTATQIKLSIWFSYFEFYGSLAGGASPDLPNARARGQTKLLFSQCTHPQRHYSYKLLQAVHVIRPLLQPYTNLGLIFVEVINTDHTIFRVT